MKAAKLSPKMKEVMSDLVTAPYYYMVDGKTLEYLYTPDGLRGYWGQHSHAHIVTDGRVVVRDHTNTLKALATRGLIEIVELGGASLDCVRVVGATYPQPMTKARKLRYTVTQWSDYCGKQLTQTFTHYATLDASQDDITACIDAWRKGWDVVSLEDQGEVDVTVWDYEV